MLVGSRLCRLRQGALNSDSQALAANAVTSVKDHGARCEITDGRQFHASWSVDTEVNADCLTSSDDFPLCHRELTGNQMAQIAEPSFDSSTEGIEINFLILCMNF